MKIKKYLISYLFESLLGQKWTPDFLIWALLSLGISLLCSNLFCKVCLMLQNVILSLQTCCTNKGNYAITNVYKKIRSIRINTCKYNNTMILIYIIMCIIHLRYV